MEKLNIEVSFKEKRQMKEFMRIYILVLVNRIKEGNE